MPLCEYRTPTLIGAENLRQYYVKINVVQGAALKAFDRRPNIDLVGPGRWRLPQARDDRIGDGAGWNDAFHGPVGPPFSKSRCVDLAVDDNVNDMNSLGM